MVIYEDTMQPCHDLTKRGEEIYRNFLEDRADEILWKHDHPFLNALEILKSFLGAITEGEERDE